MMELEEEKKSSMEKRVNCVYIQKSNLAEKCWRSKGSSKKGDLKKSDAGILHSGEKRSLKDISLVDDDNPKKIQRVSFFKLSKLDYMERYKGKRLEFFCKHTLRYFPKNKQEKIFKPPAKSVRDNVSSDCDGYNPLRQFNFPY